MPPLVDFKPALLGDQGSEEDGCLGIFAGRIVAILVRSPECCDCTNSTEWYLDKGFGSCDQHGLMFSSLDAAESWIINQIIRR